MSRASEEAHARLMAARRAECARDLTVGARVYRAGWDRVEEGMVARIDRVRYDAAGEVEDPAGDIVRYHAKFSDGAYGWSSQTFQWRWFFKRSDAEADLANKLRVRAQDARRDAEKWEALAASLDPMETVSAVMES